MNVEALVPFSFVRKTWLAERIEKGEDLGFRYEGGQYNGYVVVHKDHPYYGMDYDFVSVSVHGGLTFGESCTKFDVPELPDSYKTSDYWIFGFDTMHYGDTWERWTKEAVEKETARLVEQFFMAAIKKAREIK